jgi:hypothetical protein
MQKIPFTISIRGLVRVDAGKITINLGSTQTTVNLEASSKTDTRSFLTKGQNLFDIILKTAQDLVVSQGEDTRFSAADLYHLALEKYPYLKRGSITSHVIASAAEHPYQKHYGVKKDFFLYERNGKYRLNPKYLPPNLSAQKEEAER